MEKYEILKFLLEQNYVSDEEINTIVALGLSRYLQEKLPEDKKQEVRAEIVKLKKK